MKNYIFLISGVSGSGKTTIMRLIMDNELISFTSRPMRKGEVDGKDYIFITEEEFNELLNNNGLIESTQYGGNYYGLTRQEFDHKLSLGNCFFICDNNGMKQIKNAYKNAISIFIECSKEDAERNMKSRGDSEEQIQKRLSTFQEEMDNMIYYDYIVTNTYGNLDDAIENVKDIVYGYGGLDEETYSL